MTNSKMTLREETYRGADAMAKLADAHVTIAGVGALGSNLADTLSRQGFKRLRLIDMDRVEEQNLGTQIYGVADIGALKVDAARNIIFQNVEVEVETFGRELSEKTIKKFLKNTDLVIDAFDNARSRQLLFDHCGKYGMACLHAGLFEDYGEVVWNDTYNVPADVEGDVCDVPLARNLAMLVVSMAAEEIVEFFVAEEPRRESWSVTLKDLVIGAY